MSQQRNALKSGSFILISIALIFAVIAGIKGLRGWVEPSRLRTVTFALADDVGGLRVGDDVRIGGYKVGNVRGISIEAADGTQPRIAVAFTLPTRYLLRQGYCIRIQTSVTSTSVLNFESLGTGASLEENATLRGSASSLSEAVADVRGMLGDIKKDLIPAVGQTVAKLGRTADAISATGDEAKATLAAIRPQIPSLVEKYQALAAAAAGAAQRAAEMMVQVRDTFGESKGDWKGTLANLNAATGSVKDKLPGTLDKLNAVLAKLDSTVDGAGAALKDIQTVVADLKEVSSSAKSILVANRGKIDGMINSLKGTSDNLKNASAEIRRSPWRLLYKPDAQQASNLDLFDAARQFAQGANDLNDAAQALRDAARDKQTDPERVRKLVDRLDDSFKKFGDVEKRLWTSVKE